MSRWRRKSAASATKPNALASARPWVYASGGGRCIRPAAPQLERQAEVVRRLIGPRKSGQRRMCGLEVGIGQFETVEAAARHEEQLVAAHEARGAQFALELPLFAQDARLRVAASLAGSRKAGSDQRKAREIRRQQFHFVGRAQHDSEPPILRQPALAIVLPLRYGENQRRSLVDLGFRQVRPVVV